MPSCCLLAALLLTSGCDGINQPVAATGAGSISASVAKNPDLPDWLQAGPSDWGEEVWLEYQTFLIKLRRPLTRTSDYQPEELAQATAEVEHMPGEYTDKIREEWLAKWKPQLKSFERTGGCGCCNEIYTVTGPKAAIEEFPIEYRQSWPRYSDTEVK